VLYIASLGACRVCVSKGIKKANDFIEFWVLDNSERVSMAGDPESQWGHGASPICKLNQRQGSYESLLWTKIRLWRAISLVVEKV
jgi:hypothetical protein